MHANSLPGLTKMAGGNPPRPINKQIIELQQGKSRCFWHLAKSASQEQTL